MIDNQRNRDREKKKERKSYILCLFCQRNRQQGEPLQCVCPDQLKNPQCS